MTDQVEYPPCKGMDLVVRMLDGLQAYEPVWHAMQSFTVERDDDDQDQIWVLQHEPVFTQGQAGKAEHVLAPGSIPVIPVDRGGQVTYHGPGQLVIYFMLDLHRMGIGPRVLVSLIESAIIKTLAIYGLDAEARSDAPGVYIDGDKIASLGLRIKKERSFHGLSLNVEMDLEPFGRINPCGYSGLKMIQLSELGIDEPIEQVAGRLVQEIQRCFGYENILVEYTQSV